MISGVQVLRALASMLVITVHLAPLFAMAGISADGGHVGDVGVDMFFVISGFIMVYTTAGKTMTPAGFFLNRVIRVVPLYWAVTALYFGLGKLPIAAFAGLKPTLGALVKSLLFIPYFDARGESFPLVYVGWTLNYEMFFYLIFALSLVIRSLWARVVVMAAGFSALAALGAWVHPVAAVAYVYTQPIILEFVFGMVLGALHFEGRVLPARAAWPVLVAATLFLFGQFAFTAGSRTWFCGLPCTAILAATLALDARGRRFDNPYLMLLGAASYALYLTHPLVVSLLVKVTHATGITLGGLGVGLVAAGIVVVACLLAIAVHRFFEQPVGACLRGLGGQRR